MTSTLNSPPPGHAMQCMEIWGGNRAIDNGISAPGIDAWVYSRPHEGQERGGDIHYVSMCAAGKIGRFVVADVAGHGDVVGDIAARLRGMMRRHINTPDQTRFARTLNDEFMARANAGVFATALLATYYAPTDHLIVVNAGHPQPLWYRAAERVWTLLEPGETEAPSSGAVGNLPIGIIEPTEFHQFAAQLGKGDLIVIYTDALMEASDSAGRQLGVDGLLDLARGIDVAAPDRFIRRLVDRVTEFSGGILPDDDMTVLAMHHNGANPNRQSTGEVLRTLGRMLGLMKV